MASSSKSSSKSSTQSKKNTTAEPISSEGEMEHVGVLNSMIKGNSQVAKYVVKQMQVLQNYLLEKEDCDTMLNLIYGDSIESLKKHITSQNNREKIKAVKYKSDLEKPKNSSILFKNEYKAKCLAKDLENGLPEGESSYKKADADKLWKELSDSKKAKYKKIYDSAKAIYDTEFAKQKELAVKDGLFPMEKPKRPMTQFFIYLGEVRPQLTEKYKKEVESKKITKKEVNTKITKDASDMWKQLSDPELEKYNSMFQKAKSEYELKFAEWNKVEIERVKKLDGIPEQVEINSTGKKSTKLAKIISDDINDIVEPDLDTEEQDEEQDDTEAEQVVDIKKSTKKESSKSKKSSKSSKPSESLEDVDVDVELVKASKKGKGKEKDISNPKSKSKKNDVEVEVDINDDELVEDNIQISDNEQQDEEVEPDIIVDTKTKSKKDTTDKKKKGTKASKC